MELTDLELEQFSRQLLLKEVGYEGQLAIKGAHLLIVGLGGLGTPVAMYLASAGVGQLSLVDYDQVERSNLPRQILHTPDRIGQDKVASAHQALAQLAPHCQVHTYPQRLSETELASLVQTVDGVIDASDNFATRFMINRVCHQHGCPLVSGGAIRFEGQLTTFDFRHQKTPCYQCLYPDTTQADASCARNGVIAPLVGWIGAMQALEILKVIIGLPTLSGRLLLIDGLYSDFRSIQLTSDPDCPVCGAGASGD